MAYSDEQAALCALNKVFGYHPLKVLPLIEQSGSALALFDTSAEGEALPVAENKADAPGSASPSSASKPGPATALNAPRSIATQGVWGIRPPVSETGLNASLLAWGRRELEELDRRGFRFLGITDEDYPEALRACEDPPLGLYLNGSSSPTEIFGLRPLVAFVGTRDLSPYGKEWCRKLVASLADAQTPPCIVSGLAYGADGVAHRTALEVGLPTVGVMATGIDTVYPSRHTELAMDMVRTPGCALVTDYPLGTAPVALNFVRRNRIIAGLARAVVVVESKTRGGSLMTARYACDYGRDVFAVPGRLDDVRSAGCNSLIASDMARIVTSADALAGELGLSPRGRGAGGSWATAASQAPEEVLRALLVRRYGPGSPLVPVGLAVRSQRGATPDELASALGLPFPEVLSAVGRLEADGLVSTDLLRRCTIAPAYA